MRVYLAGPIFTQAERAWLDRLAAAAPGRGLRLLRPARAPGRDRRADARGDLPRSTPRRCAPRDALLAWLDGPIVDDGTAAEIGAFAELVRADPPRYRGIVGLVTDLRLERRRGRATGDGLNLFLAGAISASGKICWSIDEAIVALRRSAQTGTLPDS